MFKNTSPSSKNTIFKKYFNCLIAAAGTDLANQLKSNLNTVHNIKIYLLI